LPGSVLRSSRTSGSGPPAGALGPPAVPSASKAGRHHESARTDSRPGRLPADGCTR
jgi:hypothetical protein